MNNKYNNVFFCSSISHFLSTRIILYSLPFTSPFSTFHANLMGQLSPYVLVVLCCRLNSHVLKVYRYLFHTSNPKCNTLFIQTTFNKDYLQPKLINLHMKFSFLRRAIISIFKLMCLLFINSSNFLHEKLKLKVLTN